MDLEDIRDLVVIVWGSMFVLTLFVIIIATLVLLFAVKGLIGVIKETLQTDVKETLARARETAQNVKGATEFVTDSTVAPIIRIYSIFSGARQFIATLTGRGRKKRRFGIPFR